MKAMFYNCSIFNQDLSSWNVSNLKDSSYMFYNCQKINSDLNNQNMTNNLDMSYMFCDYYNFNQHLKWYVRSDANMTDIFKIN